jgi:DNA repair exonuclease SbcCD ATPase subunit
MRSLQEEGIRQQRKLEEASEAFETIAAHYADTERRLAVLEKCMSSSSDDDEDSPTVESILDYLARDAQEFSISVRSELALSLHRARERLQNFSSESEPTDDDLYALKDRVAQLEEEIDQKRAAIERKQRGNGTSSGTGGGVDIFVNYNREAAKNLAEKNALLEKKRKEARSIEAVIKVLVSEADKSVSTDLGDQKEVKQKVSKMESDIASLRRTEQLLRNKLVQESRLSDTAGRGHGGAADVASSDELKEKRAVLLDLQAEHKEKRERYERLKLRFATDRQTLQDEVDRLEKEWMSIDNSNKKLEKSNEETEAALKELNNFDSVAEEYAAELAHNESVLRKLRDRKQVIDEHYSHGSMQRGLFAKVEKMLQLGKQNLAEAF